MQMRESRCPLLLFALLMAIITAADVSAADLLVASPQSNTVLRYDGRTGDYLGTFVRSAGEALTFGPDGNLYVIQAVEGIILKCNGQTGAVIRTFVPAGTGGLSHPIALTFGPDGNLYVSSYDTSKILRYRGDTGAFISVFAAGGGLFHPYGLTFGPDRDLYVCSADGREVLRYDGTSGAFLGAFVPRDSGGLQVPLGLTFGSDGNLYVSDASVNANSVLRYDGHTGAFIDAFVPGGTGGLDDPVGLVFGPDGNLYVSSAHSGSVLRYQGATGDFIDAFVPSGSGGLIGNQWLVFTPPRAPVNLTVTAVSRTRVDLSWRDTSSDEDGFQIERRTGSGAFARLARVGPDTGAYQDLTVGANLTYTYRLRSYNARGVSIFSNEAQASTRPPAAPSELRAAALSSAQIRLTWRDNSPDERDFRLERREGEEAFREIRVLVPNTMLYLDEPLTAGRTYTYRLRSTNSLGDSPYSNLASARTAVPAAPADLTAALVGGRQIQLAWQDRSPDETGFSIERRVGTGSFSEVQRVAANTTTFLDTGVFPNTPYTYRVRAFNRVGPSGFTAEVRIVIPAAPGNLRVLAASSTGVQLAWSDNSTDELGFRIERRAGDGPFGEVLVSGANATSGSFTGLPTNAAYGFRVRAFNRSGASAYSNTAEIVLLGTPGDPAALALSSTQVSLTWSDRSEGEQGFRIERRAGTGSYVPVGLTGPGATAYLDGGVTPGVPFTYRLRAFGPRSLSDPSREVSVIPLAAPSGLTAVHEPAAGIRLRWSDRSTGETGFQIERRVDAGAFAPLATVRGATSFLDTNVAPGEEYAYRVRAVALAAFSSYSNLAAVRLPLPEGLVGWWRGEGNTRDSAGGSHGTPAAGLSYALGAVGQAFRLNGGTAGVTLPDAAALKLTGSLSLAAWIYLDAAGRPGSLFFRGDDRPGLDPYALGVEAGGQAHFHLESRTASADLFAPVPTGRFVHLVATLDGGTGAMCLYLDGALAARQVTAVRPFGDLAPAARPRCSFGYGLAGLLDEVQVYRRALPSGEVGSLQRQRRAHLGPGSGPSAR